jgi:hypothetical protein
MSFLNHGDRVTGKSSENWGRLGTVTNEATSYPATFVVIAWDDGIIERVRRASLKVAPNPPSVPSPLADNFAPDGDHGEGRAPSGISSMGSDDTELSESETSEESCVPIPTQAEPPSRIPASSGDVATQLRARVSARGRYHPPPTPSSLHAVLDRGSHGRDPIYQVWEETETLVDPSAADSFIQRAKFTWPPDVFPGELGIPPKKSADSSTIF